MSTERTSLMTKLALAAMLAIPTVIAPPLAAGELELPRPRQGYYLSLGAHGAAARAWDSAEGAFVPLFGPAGSLRLGQSLASWLDLGVGFGLAGVYDSEYRVLMGHVSLEGQLRPLDHGFVRLGVGMGFADVTRRRQGISPLLGRYGGAFRVAAGRDFFPGHRGGSGGLSLTPVAWFEAGPGREFNTFAVGVGIEVSWWTGLPRSELDLPLEEAFAAR